MDNSEKKNLINKYSFKDNYIKDYLKFKEEILKKKIIPSQVEFQAPPRGKKICWMECPYCYGLSATDNGERLGKERGLEILDEIIDGGVNKIIFAGYATDPLNCGYIDDLLEKTIQKNAIFGFNTKILKVSDKFINLLDNQNLVKGSYMSLSIDAGSDRTYKEINNIKSYADIFGRVLKNVQKIVSIRKKNKNFDLSAAYLLNAYSAKNDDISNFIEKFIQAGCNLLRFTFPQPPKDIITSDGTVPSPPEKKEFKNKVINIIEKYKNNECPILFVDADEEYNIFNKAQSLPCFARYVYPTVGFDGWLYNCSQSSAPNFRESALGDLNKNNFWDLFYNYEDKNFKDYFKSCNLKIKNSNCRCDRKEHLLNLDIREKVSF